MDNNMEDADQSAEWLLPTHSSGTGGIFGDPQITPRVGEEYQARIPTLITENDRLQLIELPICLELLMDVQNHVDFGLSLPVMWICDQNGSISEDTMKIDVNTDVAQVEMNDAVLTENANELPEGNADLLGSAMDVREEMTLQRKEDGLLLVPGSLGESWNEIEHDSFLLGLYIFGKNLRLVTKFIGNKGMGSVLSYYYGEFYRSSEYQRWSQGRKKKTRRSIHGDKIFSGWRHQQLLSRLSSNVTEECKNSLTEASKTFGEGKLSLEEYVFILKDMVGINMLVEAVAIGKEKKDLTGTAMEPLKNSNSFQVRQETPTWKACSSLTTEEIVKILKGDIRLSKAKSSDLFWEAVWPRLLARGWHSEQPKNYIFPNSKHTLVFLVPGVAKFSRRKLEKGSHYFDSVTDVLHKVASEPELIELETEQDALADPHMKQGSDDKEKHSYLQPQPQVPQYNQELYQFTIVDTSLVRREKGRLKVIEVRSLPLGEYANIPTSSGISGETEQDTTEESQNEEDVNHSILKPDEQDDTESCNNVSDSPEVEAIAVNNDLQVNCLDPMISETEDKKPIIFADGQSRKNMKFKLCRKAKAHHSNDKGMATLRYELKMCESHSGPKPDDATDENYRFQYKPPSGDDEDEVAVSCAKKKRQRTLIDLNLPQVARDSDSDEPLLSSTPPNLPETTSNHQHQPELPNPSNAAPARIEQQPATTGQRHSTRTRPLTAKALEAFACGYLSPKKKRKSGEAKPPKRARAKTALVSSCGAEDIEKSVDGVFGGTSHMVCESPK